MSKYMCETVKALLVICSHFLLSVCRPTISESAVTFAVLTRNVQLLTKPLATATETVLLCSVKQEISKGKN